MRIARHGVGAVGDFDHSTIAAPPADETDPPRCRRLNRCPACRCEIDAGVHPDVAKDRMRSAPEHRAEARTLDRLCEDAQHLAIDVDRRLTAAVVRPYDLVKRTADLQCGEGKLGLSDPVLADPRLAPEKP